MIKIALAFLMSLPVTIMAQSGEYSISGKIGNLQAPARVYLWYSKENQRHTDSCLLDKGRFIFKGSIDEPVHASIFLIRNDQGLQWPYDELMFYIAKGNTVINSSDSINNAVVTGTKINVDLYKYNKQLAAPMYELHAVDELRESSDSGLKSSPEFRSTIDSLIANGVEHLNAVRKRFIQQNPGSYISLDALTGLSYFAKNEEAFSEMDTLMMTLSTEIKNCAEGKRLMSSITKQRALITGKPAPEFVLPDTAGHRISLSSFRGRYVLIDFWASWCKPCRAENPVMIRIYETFKKENFSIIGISTDQQRTNWIKAISDDKLPWLQLSDLKQLNEAADLYQIRSIPSNFLIDPDGHIVAANLHGQELVDKLEQIFTPG